MRQIVTIACDWLLLGYRTERVDRRTPDGHVSVTTGSYAGSRVPDCSAAY